MPRIEPRPTDDLTLMKIPDQVPVRSYLLLTRFTEAIGGHVPHVLEDLLDTLATDQRYRDWMKKAENAEWRPKVLQKDEPAKKAGTGQTGTDGRGETGGTETPKDGKPGTGATAPGQTVTPARVSQKGDTAPGADPLRKAS